MQNYQEILQNANAELSKLQSEKAVLESKIKEQATSLGLDLEKPLKEQIDAEVERLQSQFSEKEAELKEVLMKLEGYKAEGDGSSDFE